MLFRHSVEIKTEMDRRVPVFSPVIEMVSSEGLVFSAAHDAILVMCA